MKSLPILLAACLCLACSLTRTLPAQDIPARPDTSLTSPLGAVTHEKTFIHRIGLFGSFNILLHRSDFNTLPGVPSCCPHYLSGKGEGVTVGVSYEHVLEEGWLVGARLAYERVEGRFTDREPTTFIIDSVKTPGAFEHRLDAGYGMVTLQPFVGYRLLDNVAGRFSLVANAGIGFGMKTGSHFAQREEIVEPAGYGIYIQEGGAARNDYTGEIPQAIPFMMDLRIGVALEARLNRARTLTLAPELWYSLGMSPVVNTINWSVDGLRAGLAIHYAIPNVAPSDTTGR